MKMMIVGTVIQVGKGRCLLLSEGVEHDIEVEDEATQRELGARLHKLNAIELELDVTISAEDVAAAQWTAS